MWASFDVSRSLLWASLTFLGLLLTFLGLFCGLLLTFLGQRQKKPTKTLDVSRSLYASQYALGSWKAHALANRLSELKHAMPLTTPTL